MCEDSRKEDAHGYQPYIGIPALREAFSDWYKRWYGVELNPKTEIQPLIGSKEGILHISLAFLNPGDGVLVPNPGYPTYTSVSKLFVKCKTDVGQLSSYADRNSCIHKFV